MKVYYGKFTFILFFCLKTNADLHTIDKMEIQQKAMMLFNNNKTRHFQSCSCGKCPT